MAIVPYLAMTATELAGNKAPACPIAWMACHFSPYSTGLSNLPAALPKGSLLILNDRTPVFGHNPKQIAGQLEELVTQLECAGILLDFQRPGEERTQSIATAVAALPCPVAVTPAYAEGLDCAVFLPPPPLTTPLGDYLQPWQEREIWLEIAKEATLFRVDGSGCKEVSESAPFPCPHQDERLICQYGMAVQADHIHFYLRRDAEMLQALMEKAADLGVKRFVGLFQELTDWA